MKMDVCEVVKSLPEDRWLHHGGSFFRANSRVCVIGCLMEAAGLFGKYSNEGKRGEVYYLHGIADDLSDAYGIPISMATLDEWILANDADISNLAIMQELVCDYVFKVKSYDE